MGAGTGTRRRTAVRLVVAVLTGVLAVLPLAPAPAAAASPVSVWVQTLDACSGTIGGVALRLSGGGSTATATVPGGASRTVGAGGCPAQHGDCTGPSPSGCVVFTLTPPRSGTRTYTLQQSSVPSAYAPCDGGSACLGEVASFTLDSTGAVLGATVTDTLPDGVVTTLPTSGASFAASSVDPIVLHDDPLGPGVCDGDGDADDQLAGQPTPHCDDHSDASLAHLVIAGTAPDGTLVEGAGFHALAPEGAPAGRRLVGSPAVIAGTALDPALEIGTFDDGNLYARSDAAGWQPLSSSPPGFSCVDNPAAYLDHADDILWVACEGADHTLHYATGSLPATSLQLPVVSGWQSIPGLQLAAGPALAPAGPGATADPTFFAVDPAGVLWTATSSSGWVRQGGTCRSHPAAVLGDTGGTPTTVVACAAPDGSLLYGVVAADGSVGLAPAAATAPPTAEDCELSGRILDGPGIAATGSGVLILVTSAVDHLPYAKSITFQGTPGSGPTAISPYQALAFQQGPSPGTCSTLASPQNPIADLASGPAVATWSGAALTVGVTRPAILAAPHSATTAVAHLVDASGNPVSGRTVTFTTTMLADAAATRMPSAGVYTASITTGDTAGPVVVGAATEGTQGSTRLQLFRGGYVVDGWGSLHAFGGAPQISGTAYWRGQDLARGVVLNSDGTGGYVLDAYGGLHPFGTAPPLQTTAYWPGQNLARGVALRSDGVSGWVLDAYGGLHPFGGAPALAGSAYWPGWDIARGITLVDDGGGYVLDGYGGLHAFGDAPPAQGGTYWPGWDIARAVAMRPDGPGGYVLDGWGGVHPFGGAPPLATTADWPGWSIARGLVIDAGGEGMVLDGYGGLSPIAGTTPEPDSAYWKGWDIARGVAGD